MRVQIFLGVFGALIAQCDAAAWTQADLTAATEIGDATKCYYGIFSAEPCAEGTTGGIYLIDPAWYTGHFGGSFASKNCGTVIANWGTISPSHPVSALTTKDKLDYSGETRATYEADWDCAAPTAPTTTTTFTAAPAASFDFEAECEAADNYVTTVDSPNVQYCSSYDATKQEYTNYMRVPITSAWGAIGINSKFAMHDTEMAALSFKDGAPVLEYRKAVNKQFTALMDVAPQNSEVGASTTGGLTAKWTRAATEAGLLDLSDGTASLVVVAAYKLGSHGSFVGQHSKTPEILAGLDLQTAKSFTGVAAGAKGNSQNLAHGALMIFAWACLSPIGSMFMRYGKHLPLSFWFKTHTYIQPLAVLFTIIAFILILMSGVTLSELTGTSKTHALCGLAVVVLCIVQGILGYAREKISAHQESDTDTDFNHGPRRYIFNMLHKSNGWALFGLSLATIHKGLTLFDGPENWIKDPAATLFMAYALIAAALIVILELVHIAQGKYDFSTGGPFTCSGDKNVAAQTKATDDFEMKLRSVVLALFTAFSMAVTVGLWVIIADTPKV